MIYTIAEAWKKACKAEGIPADSKFVVFSEGNEWAVKYNKAMKLKLASLR